MVMKGIDYGRLANAKEFYSTVGYEFIHLPWVVDVDIANITKPSELRNFYVKEDVLVASGEQSFLQLSLKENLEPGIYQGVTPCFRDEGTIDRLHQPYFIKLELFQSIDVNMENLGRMINDAQSFFSIYAIDTVKTITDDGFDINTKNGIELGSYGIREVNGFKWIYGTGLAEPRLTNALMI